MSKTYPPVGTCIYCGNDREKLTKEHIVALGLNGMHTLPESSCTECAGHTSKAERICLRQMFQHLRAFGDMNTRRPKDRPIEFHLNYSDAEGDKVAMLATDEYPTCLLLFDFEPPRLLSGNEGPPLCKPWVWYDRSKLRKFAESLGHGRFQVRPAVFQPLAFMQMLAKVAHSYAVANYGVDSFDYLATELIFGRDPHPEQIVGGAHGVALSGTNDCAYKLAHQVTPEGFILVHIQLFPNLNTPVYQVVVGRIRPLDGDAVASGDET